MTHSTECPSCQAPIEISYEDAGLSVVCPNCSSEIEIVPQKTQEEETKIPTPEAATVLDPAVDQAEKTNRPAPSGEESSPPAGIIVGIVFWALIVLALVVMFAVQVPDVFGAIIGLIVLVPVYFFPIFLGRNNRNVAAISIITIFLGWTLIGWVVALVWAVYKPEETSKPSQDAGK